MCPLNQGYPDPATDGALDPGSVPLGGPYPDVRTMEEPESESTQTEASRIKPEAPPPPPPPQYPFWLLHRGR